MKLPVYIMGFMGSGKSSFGKKLANFMQLEHMDLDEFIEGLEGRTITEIFEQDGEAYFREKEFDALQRTQGKEAIISLGGGTACHELNIRFIKTNGSSLYLKKDVRVLISRLINSKKKRPLIEGKTGQELLSYVSEKLLEREKFYNQADFIIEELNPKPKEVAAIISSR